MRKVVIDGIGLYETELQVVFQSELELDLSKEGRAPFNLKAALWDTRDSTVAVHEYDDASKLDPIGVDETLKRYQLELLRSLVQARHMANNPSALDVRIHGRVFGEATTRDLKKLRRTIKLYMQIRIQIGLEWPDKFTLDPE